MEKSYSVDLGQSGGVRNAPNGAFKSRYSGVMMAGEPGRGASNRPLRPSALNRFIQRRTVCSFLRTIRPIWDADMFCSTANRIICIRVRMRTSLVLSYAVCNSSSSPDFQFSYLDGFHALQYDPSELPCFHLVGPNF